VKNPDPQPVTAGIGESHKSTYVIAANVFSLLLIWSPSLQVGRDEFGQSWQIGAAPADAASLRMVSWGWREAGGGESDLVGL